MKKLLTFLFLMGLASIARADLFGNIEDKSALVKYDFAVGANVSTSALVIDLSDTSNWPHKEKGELNITQIRLGIDKTAASTCTVRLGVITFVDESSGSVKWFWEIVSQRNVSNTNVTVIDNPTMSYYRLRVNPVVEAVGTTPFIISNQTTLSSTNYQSDIGLPSPNTTTSPGIGDMVMQVINGTVAIDISLEGLYHARRR